MTAVTIDDARATLLRVLDELEQAEADLEGAPDRVDLVVVYSVGRSIEGDADAWHEVGGWACTSGPKWLHAALIRRAADAFDNVARAVDDDDEGDE